MAVIVGVDVDGVLRDLVGGLTKTYVEYYPDHEVKPVTEWGLEKFFPIGEVIYDFLWGNEMSSYDCYAKSEPYPGAVDFVRDLSRVKDVEVAIVTTQPYLLAKSMTFAWLEGYSILPHAQSVIMLSGSLKRHNIGLDILIDDCTDNLRRCKDTLPVCFDRPWNQDWRMSPRAYSYNDCLEYVRDVVHVSPRYKVHAIGGQYG